MHDPPTQLPPHLKRIAFISTRIAAEFFSFEVIADELRAIVRHPQNLYRLLARNKARRKMLEELKNG